MSIKREVRGAINLATRRLMKNELTRKHAVVAIENLASVPQIICVNRKEGCNNREASDLLCIPNLKNDHFVSEHYKANAYYGIGPAIKSYSHYKIKIPACIEHGLFFDDYCPEHEVINSGLPAIITMGENRAHYLKTKTEKLIIQVGPYIQYVEHFLSEEELCRAKCSLGKTLLVIPGHSSSFGVEKTDWNDLFNHIERILNNTFYDSVIINLYYKDVSEDNVRQIRSRGFIPTCCGNRLSPDFLSRLRSIISLADYSISNTVGTHIGYCIWSGVPHMLVDFKSQIEYSSEFDRKWYGSRKANDAISDQEIIKSAFSSFEPQITEEQMGICKSYWGLGNKLAPDEMFHQLAIAENYLRAKQVFDQ